MVARSPRSFLRQQPTPPAGGWAARSPPHRCRPCPQLATVHILLPSWQLENNDFPERQRPSPIRRSSGKYVSLKVETLSKLNGWVGP